ncbi:MAG: hypothetical protein IPP19_16735 [Verrucomicrobia bacterium]|nr:hypothetical protein [Verrucomicrobiota bacterium]
MSETAPKLPALQQTVLDEATLDALFRDLAQCTQILAVIPKGAPQAYAAERGIDLEAARAGLASGIFRGVQVRYRYDGQEWCDTLLATPGGVRLVRISVDETLGSGVAG